MIPRSYNQFCPIAHALDLVGDRWALLIVRDLVMGPKRFTDLFQGLPGIGTNILTGRLKDLEAADIVQRRVLPPPAASTIYELTLYGRDLNEAITALARWGSQTLGVLKPGQRVSQDSLMLGLQAIFRRIAGQAGGDTYQIIVKAEGSSHHFGVEIGVDDVTITPGLLQKSDVTLNMSVETLYGLAGGTLAIAEAKKSGILQMSGSNEIITRFFKAFD